MIKTIYQIIITNKIKLIINKISNIFLVYSGGADLLSISDFDSAGLQDTKNQVLNAIQRFISDIQTDPPANTPTNNPLPVE